MYRIGVDLGGTNIKAGIMDESYKILIKDSVPTGAERGFEAVVKDMAELVLNLMQRKSISEKDVIGVGIGSPGSIDPAKGVVTYSNNLDWNDAPLADELMKMLPFKVKVSNDANCATLGEVKAGAATNVDNVVLLTLGTGVGGGIVSEGKILEGGHAGGMELGHTMLLRGGAACTCGRKGCLEAYASATALIRQTKEAAKENPESKIHEICGNDLSKVNGKTAFLAAQMDDETGKKVVSEYIGYLGDGIVDFINVFRPDVVLLSGGICNEGKNLTDPVNEFVQKNCYATANNFIPKVVTAILGNDAGLIGAAALVD